MRNLFLLFGIVLAAGALVLSACSAGASDERVTALEERVAEVEARADRAGLVATMYLLDSSGFHGMDETINNEGRIEARYEGVVERARAAVMATRWPDELRPTADELLRAMNDLLPALRANDPAAAGPAAKRVHDLEHDLAHDAWAYLAGEESGGEGDGH